MSIEISDGGHDFESKTVGYEKPVEPQWVQDIVFCYRPPILKWTCKKCGYSFQGRSGLLLTMMAIGMPKCPEIPTYSALEGLPVTDSGE